MEDSENTIKMDYFEKLEKETHYLYKIANEARSKGFDVETETEIPLAKDLAERVEGLVGPVGVAKRMKELEEKNPSWSREKIAFKLAAEISSQKIEEDLNNNGRRKEKKVYESFGETFDSKREQIADQALRTALAILTEGVVAAPIEGIAKVKIKKNFDGTEYLAVYFAGPIRSAGGTAAALAVLIGDCIKVATNLSNYKPIDAEIERYVEEVELYESEVTNLQYSPKPEEVRLAAQNIPVEVTGEQTDQVEVSHRDLERVETNNIRGGALLAMVEGIIQKSAKVLKYSHTLKLDGWDWLEGYSKEKKKNKDKQDDKQENKKENKEEKSKHEAAKENAKYIQDIIGGRPVLGYPSEKGGFRLRYGRSRNTGLAAMGVNPATMQLLEFLAVGTQLKIERPGKGNCVVPVDSIEGPIIKLKNGNVVKINSVKEAKAVKGQVAEILFLGDMLVAFGEFLRNNQTLLPSAWCEEWWIETIKNSSIFDENDFLLDSNPDLTLENLGKLEMPEYSYISAEEAFEISKKYDIPLHPLYTYCYNDISMKDLNSLIKWINKYKKSYDENDKEFKLDLSFEKRILEIIGVPHKIEGRIDKNEDVKVILNPDDAYALIHTLSKEISKDDLYNPNISSLEALNNVSPVLIKDKAPIYIGTRVGRPEKSKERLMRPAPHVLFPIGNFGGNRRLVAEASKKGKIAVELSRRVCTNPQCQLSSFNSICPHCGSPTEIGSPGRKNINLSGMLRKASDNVSYRRVDEIKGVIGMISESKLPEPLEKGVLRAKNEVFTFKDATIRHDSTDLPLTHFIPKEIGVTVEKLLEMGYDKDAYGNPIEDENQVIELKVQDVVISNNCGDYLVNVANYVDDLLDKFYSMDRFYNVNKKQDLIGNLIVGLAPHTSAGVLGRIVGFTKALACYAHPYFHSAKRRNCDSDEDSVMLLLDALINFSKSYLPSTRGGSMDAPLVLSSRIDPEEIDDESHNIDVLAHFSEGFFEKTYEGVKPSDALDLVDNVSMHLGTYKQYEDLMFSHNTSNIHAGPNICLYKTLPSMKEKVESQIELAEKIRAVDQRGVVEGVLSSHFLPDIMGNVRAFSKQKVRCTSCGSKYRRMPLTGKCKCGSDLVLSVSKGSVTKYLEISRDLVARYPITHYLTQRLEIQEFGIDSLFESDKSKQSSLDIFL
ncbi:DNA polymerase II large subunit [Methanobrevibacter arboriphilus]|jgi:DNA polymerase II large subunit|uniref:DNA polymerase II large subunit n=1 Tax=Methanobrevibacter arboriphilus TaxID=39441 RepID=A0ACA8R2Z8_METAZ|nr:DNA polymerase II large subunit [Methanobrevibacter arboriphilus]GLI11157.1 DNA polymerase II large subunit [Methanobrevibacter arboriphilus]